MANKYTVTSGVGALVHEYYRTEWLILALIHLWSIRVDNHNTYWKQLQIN